MGTASLTRAYRLYKGTIIYQFSLVSVDVSSLNIFSKSSIGSKLTFRLVF